MTIRLLIADDHAVLRTGLRMLLEAQPDMAVVGEAANGGETITQVERLHPDVVLLDLTMPDGGGLEAIRRITAAQVGVRVLVLTMHDDEGYLRSALEAGSAGYVLKRAADVELLSAIRAVYSGGTYLHPEHTKLLLEPMASVAETGEIEDTYERLSPREQEVLRLLALGHTNQRVADMLYLSVKTVETYKARVMQKLDLKGRPALVRYALRRGLLDEPSS